MTLKAFCEDPKQVQPEEFFGSFDSFLTAMTDTRHENEKFKKQKEEEEKRKHLEEQVKKKKAHVCFSVFTFHCVFQF